MKEEKKLSRDKTNITYFDGEDTVSGRSWKDFIMALEKKVVYVAGECSYNWMTLLCCQVKNAKPRNVDVCDQAQSLAKTNTDSRETIGDLLCDHIFH